uniref:Uncharacterized protein n=1 Tax=Moniliophthora roreri TaxID=221103 RepID=A0A0W0EU00_MONRR
MLTDDTIEHGTLLISAQSVVRNFLFPSDPAKAALIQNGCNNSTSPCRLINYMRWIKGCRAVIIPREFLLDLVVHERFSNTPSPEWKSTLITSRREPISTSTFATTTVREESRILKKAKSVV